MNPYEMTFIVRPDLDDEQLRAAIDAVTGRLESVGGEIIATYNWTPPRRRMAFPIRDFGDGYYVTTTFRLSTDRIGEIEGWLKLNDAVLRYLLVRATDMAIRHSQQRQHQAQQPQPQPVPVPAATGAPAPATQTQAAAQPAPAAQPEPETQPASAPSPEPEAEPAAVAEEQVQTQPAEPADSAAPAPAGQTGAAPEPVAVAPAAETQEEA